MEKWTIRTLSVLLLMLVGAKFTYGGVAWYDPTAITYNYTCQMSDGILILTVYLNVDEFMPERERGHITFWAMNDFERSSTCWSQTMYAGERLYVDDTYEDGQFQFKEITYDVDHRWQTNKDVVGDCLVSFENETTDTVCFNALILLHDSPVLGRFTVKCDVDATINNNPTNGESNVEQSWFLEDIPTLPPGVPSIPEAVDCFATDDPTVSVPPPTLLLDLGQPFYIVCILIVGQNAHVRALFIKDVIFSNTEDMSGEIVDIIKNGCVDYPDRGNPHWLFYSEQFNMNSRITQIDGTPIVDFNATATPIVGGSNIQQVIGPFNGYPFLSRKRKWESKLILNIRILLLLSCLSVADPKCVDQMAWCKMTGNYDNTGPVRTEEVVVGGAPAIRKRRSTEEERQFQFEIELLDVNANGDANKLDQDAAQNTPSPQTFYWMLAAILGVLLLLIVVVCVVLALRLRRRRLDKEEAFEGHKNPAYN